MNNKYPLNGSCFFFNSFFIVTSAVVISALVVVFLSRFNVFTQPNPLILLGWLGIISIMVSTAIAQIIGKKYYPQFLILTKQLKKLLREILILDFQKIAGQMK